MTVNEVIDRYGDSALGSLSIRVAMDRPGAAGTIVLESTQDGFTFLGNLARAFVEYGDCHFDLAPFCAGCAYFHSSGIDGPGLYLHLQPCVSEIEVFPLGMGIGWLCWAPDGARSDKRDWDPSYIVFEGRPPGFRWLAETFLRAASNPEMVSAVSPDAARRHFGNTDWRLDFAIRSE